MVWKTITEQIECKKCKGIQFTKETIEEVSIKDVSNYNRENKPLGGMWNETPIKEHKVTFKCSKCGHKMGRD